MPPPLVLLMVVTYLLEKRNKFTFLKIKKFMYRFRIESNPNAAWLFIFSLMFDTAHILCLD
jgi:hypothetical protein